VTAHDDTSRSVTFAEWDRECDAVAGGLAATGVEAGDRILLPITNAHAVDFAVAYLAAQRAGAIAVPLNTRLSKEEMQYFAELTQARWLVTDVPDRVEGLTGNGFWTVDTVPRDAAAVPDQQSLDAEGDADIISTSGTTGRPKGVVFSHADLLDRAGGGTASSPSKILLHALPFTGFGGCHGLMMASLYFGSTIITQPSFSASGMTKLVEHRRPDTLHLVPSMLRLILDEPDIAARDFGSVRWIITGTAPVPNTLVRRAAELWPHLRIVNTYGMTESSVGVATRTQASVLKPGSVGKPADPASVEIRDGEGQPLQPGQQGEVWTRARRPRRYWADSESSAATWQAGWLKTGDVGYFDGDGDLILTGRSKELIIRGGYNISPAEVENVLHAHPDVADVAVLGVPHPVLGEDVAASVVLRPGAALTPTDLAEWCRQRLADNKVPRTIVFRPALPYNQNGKVTKAELAAELSTAAEADRQQRAAERAR
jgi:acyl-CoA synthetase (AMP-forming)/AMP-acid ligase II